MSFCAGIRAGATLAVALVCAPSWAAQPRIDGNLHAYDYVSSLAQAFDFRSSKPDKPFEIAPPGQWFRVEGVKYTGKIAEADPKLAGLLLAWRESRDGHPEAGEPVLDDDFPRIQVELEHEGKKFWLLMSELDVLKLYKNRAPTPELLTVFVQRVGVVKGEPQVWMHMLGEVEQVRIGMESQKRNPPGPRAVAPDAPPPPPPSRSMHIAAYGQGEARFRYGGRAMKFPLRKFTANALPRGLYKGYPPGTNDLWLQYCSDEMNCLEIRAHEVGGSGSEPTVQVRLKLDGQAVNTDFSGSCHRRELRASPSEVLGVFECRQTRGLQTLEALEFTAAP